MQRRFAQDGREEGLTKKNFSTKWGRQKVDVPDCLEEKSQTFDDSSVMPSQSVEDCFDN